MTSREIARQWFVPGDGIDRHVISADIQRYLGNDATVRPGKGTGEHAGVDGFWIKAYRNLTSAMIVDLRADSQRWRQEQRQTGTREPYVTSTTYQQSSAGRPSKRAGDSPRAPDYGSSARDRMPASRMHPMDSMDVDPPRASMFAPGPSSRGEAYPPDSRASFPSDRAYQAEAAMSNPGYGGRPPVPSGFGNSAPGYVQQPNDQAPPGYVRQGNYYVPISGYDQPPSVPSRADPPYGGNPGFGGQPPYPAGRDMPRYGGPEYQDPSNAYPSPAATVSSVPARDRGANSAAPSYGGQMPPVQYDQYGRPIKDPSPGYGAPSRESLYSRGNPQSNMDSRDRRRR